MNHERTSQFIDFYIYIYKNMTISEATKLFLVSGLQWFRIHNTVLRTEFRWENYISVFYVDFVRPFTLIFCKI